MYYEYALEILTKSYEKFILGEGLSARNVFYDNYVLNIFCKFKQNCMRLVEWL